MLRFLASLFGLVPSITVLAHDHAAIASSDVTIVIGKDGHVYSSGDAVEIRGDQRPGTRCHFEVIDRVSDAVSVDVCVNGTAAGALDRHGKVWLWGREWSSTVRGAETDQWHVPMVHAGLEDIRSFSLADSHLIALKKDGSVVTAASNYDGNDAGQLGTGDLKTPSPMDRHHGVFSIPEINDAVAVEAASEFNLILRSDGTLWGMGSTSMLGEASSLTGFLNEEPKLFRSPTPIAGLKNIASISAGHRFAIALDRSGQVWGWGVNHAGQLGPSVSDFNTISPQKILGFNHVKSIAAGYDFILALTDAGRVLAMGGNVYGALGDEAGELEGAKRTIPGLKNVEEVFAGHYNGFAKTKSGELWGWGSNNRQVGGFHATSGGGFLAPTKIDIGLKPAPPSEVLAQKGVKLTVTFDFQDYFFESQSMKFIVDSKVVGTMELNEQHDEKSFSLEVPAGSTNYQVTGTGTDDSGKVTPIVSQGTFVVSDTNQSDQFEEAVERDGLISATKALITRFDQMTADQSLLPIAFAHSETLTDEELDQIEKSAGRRLPASYRNALKSIGPFRLGSPNSPHPPVSLMVPDKNRNLLSYAQAAEKTRGDDSNPKGTPKLPDDDTFRDVIDAFAYMADVLPPGDAQDARRAWADGLIVGSCEDDLYLLFGGNRPGSDQPCATLWAPFFHELENDDGDAPEYFQWAEVASSDTDEEVQRTLATGVYQALFNAYARRGITPLLSTPTNEVVYASFDIRNEEEPEGEDPYEATLSSDGW